MKRLYITGTDTEIGKTRVSCQLLRALQVEGISTAAYKPISAGAELIAGQLRNEDALALMAASSTAQVYGDVNPWCFAEAVAPHFLVAEAGIQIDTQAMARIIANESASVALIEGVGGWLAPLDANTTQADMARACGAAVILVVGMRLGCINHALLSAERIQSDGLVLAGWVANQVDAQMPRYLDNIETLSAAINAPLLATVAWEQQNITLDQGFIRVLHD